MVTVSALSGASGLFLLLFILIVLGLLTLFILIFYLLVKNAVKWGTYEAILKYLDYMDECESRLKSKKTRQDLDD